MKRWMIIAALVFASVSAGRATAKPRTKASLAAPRVLLLPKNTNDLQELLDVRTWEFDVRYPVASRLTAVLEVRKKGVVTKVLTIDPSFGYDNLGPGVITIGKPSLGKSRHVRLLVSLLPPNGGLGHSDELKYAVRVREYRTLKRIVTSLNGSAFRNNPFNSLDYVSGFDASLQKDGSFLLIGGAENMDKNFQEAAQAEASGHPKAELYDTALTLRFK